MGGQSPRKLSPEAFRSGHGQVYLYGIKSKKTLPRVVKRNTPVIIKSRLDSGGRVLGYCSGFPRLVGVAMTCGERNVYECCMGG